MNAKELRLQASYIVEQWDNHDRFRIVESDAAFMNADGEPDAVTFARHILAAVRDDDDEPVTKERFYQASGDDDLLFLNGSSDWFIYWMDGIRLQVEKHSDNVFVCESKYLGKMTMGQFRALCRGLGLELREGE